MAYVQHPFVTALMNQTAGASGPFAGPFQGPPPSPALPASVMAGPPGPSPLMSDVDFEMFFKKSLLPEPAKTEPPEFVAVVGRTTVVKTMYVLVSKATKGGYVPCANMPVEAEELAIRTVAHDYHLFVDMDLVPTFSSVVVRLALNGRTRPGGYLTFEVTDIEWRKLSAEDKALLLKGFRAPERIYTNDGYHDKWRLEFFDTMEALRAKADYLDDPLPVPEQLKVYYSHGGS